MPASIERWEFYVSPYEKKLKCKLDDEIKLAGLEAGWCQRSLGSTWSSTRTPLRTFEEARLEIVTYAEATLGLRIRDARPGEAAFPCTI